MAPVRPFAAIVGDAAGGEITGAIDGRALRVQLAGRTCVLPLSHVAGEEGAIEAFECLGPGDERAVVELSEHDAATIMIALAFPRLDATLRFSPRGDLLRATMLCRADEPRPAASSAVP